MCSLTIIVKCLRKELKRNNNFNKDSSISNVTSSASLKKSPLLRKLPTYPTLQSLATLAVSDQNIVIKAIDSICVT